MPRLALLALFALLPLSASAQRVVLSRDAATPLDRVAFESLPEITDTLIVVVRASGHVPSGASVERGPDGARLVVPAHPDPMRGGPVALDVYDGPRRLGTVERFEIRPIPTDPGALGRLLALHRRAIELQAERYGFALADLREITPDLPVHLWPSAVALDALDGVDNPNSLRALMDGTSPLSGDPALADAIAGLIGAESLVETYIAALVALGLPPEPPTFSAAAGGAPPPALQTVPRRGPSAGDAPPTGRGAWHPAPLERVEIHTPDQLSYYMREAEVHHRVGIDAGIQLFGQINDLVGAAPTLVTQVASTIVSGGMFALLEDAMAKSALLPSVLYGPEASFTVAAFDEDAVTPGEWSEYTVFARSRDWNVGGTALRGMAELFLAALSVGGATESVAKDAASEGASQTAERIVRGSDVADWLVDLEAGLVQMGVTNAAKDAARATGDAAGRDNAVVGPYYWGPFDITRPRYSTARVVGLGDHLLRIDSDARTYSPWRAGQGQLALNPDTGRFPPVENHAAGAVYHDVVVQPISVQLLPSTATVLPGESVRIEASVRHASNPELRWTLDAPSGVVLDVDTDTQGATLFFPDADDLPMVAAVTATSLSTTGARDPALDPPVRETTAAYAADNEEPDEEPTVCGPPYGATFYLAVSGPQFGGTHRFHHDFEYDDWQQTWTGLSRIRNGRLQQNSIMVTYVADEQDTGSMMPEGFNFTSVPPRAPTQVIPASPGTILVQALGPDDFQFSVVAIGYGPRAYGRGRSSLIMGGPPVGQLQVPVADVTVETFEPGVCAEGAFTGAFGEAGNPSFGLHTATGTFRVSLPPDDVLEVDMRR